MTSIVNVSRVRRSPSSRHRRRNQPEFFAAALMRGLTVQEAARTCGLTKSSGRTYLARIFAKTGTHRQTELMTLLSSMHPLSGGDDPATGGGV